MVTPLAGLGGPNILLKNVSRSKDSLSTNWGNGIVLILLSGGLFTLALLGLGPTIVGRHTGMSILLLSVSELLLGRIGELAGFAFIALSRIRETALINIYASVSKVVCVVALSMVKSNPTVEDWAVAYFWGSLVCAAYAFLRVLSISGMSFDLSLFREELVEGSYFAIGTSAATIYNDIDKTMLARLADLTSTGIYGAAYKIIDVSMAPIRAMTASAYAEFFRRGAEGPHATLEYANKLIRRSAPYGFLILIGLLLAAPILPMALGKGYYDSIEAVRWLAIIPLIRCGHSFLGDAISGAGFQGYRATAQTVVAVVNIALNVHFIRHWGWRGAAWTSVLSDGLLLAAFALILKAVQNDDASTLARRTLVGAPLTNREPI
jgi:O-antigen/teichoic acid export membrane protein